jgi:8-oxo-dGTP diphosphatase
MSGKKVFVCVDGLYVRNGLMLLLKRRLEPFKGCWCLPGGHVDENETLTQALKREFREETNLDILVGELLAGRIEETSDRTKVILTFEVTSAQGEIRLNSESQEYGWFTSTPPNSVYDYAKYLK